VDPCPLQLSAFISGRQLPIDVQESRCPVDCLHSESFHQVVVTDVCALATTNINKRNPREIKVISVLFVCVVFEKHIHSQKTLLRSQRFIFYFKALYGIVNCWEKEGVQPELFSHLKKKEMEDTNSGSAFLLFLATTGTLYCLFRKATACQKTHSCLQYKVEGSNTPKPVETAKTVMTVGANKNKLDDAAMHGKLLEK
jgi:hypothetical protein